MNNKFKTELTKLYTDFFSQHDIDLKFGLKELKNKSSKSNNENKFIRFATYPFIGKKYGTENKPKILFVGLDIGKDEKNIIQNFDERYNSIMNQPYNSHKSGTYLYSAFFLQNNIFEQYKILNLSFISAYKYISPILTDLNFNPLDYICLTNFYKFVTQGRIKRSGGKDRKFYIGEKEEISLFIKEIEILNPDKIIFQSNTFSQTLLDEVDKYFANKKTINSNLNLKNIIKTYHPSRNLSKLNKGVKEGKNTVFIHFQQSNILDSNCG